MRPRVFLWTALLFSLTASCALPIPGEGWREVMVGTASWNPALGALHRRLIGLDLRACRELAGLTSGYSEVEVIYPVPARTPVSSEERGGLHFVFPLGLAWTTGSGTRHRLGWFLFAPDVPSREDVFFVCHTYVGAGVGIGPQAGGYLGAGRATALSVAPGTSGVFSLVFNSRDPSGNRLGTHTELIGDETKID